MVRRPRRLGPGAGQLPVRAGREKWRGASTRAFWLCPKDRADLVGEKRAPANRRPEWESRDVESFCVGEAERAHHGALGSGAPCRIDGFRLAQGLGDCSGSGPTRRWGRGACVWPGDVRSRGAGRHQAWSNAFVPDYRKGPRGDKGSPPRVPSPGGTQARQSPCQKSAEGRCSGLRGREPGRRQSLDQAPEHIRFGDRPPARRR